LQNDIYELSAGRVGKSFQGCSLSGRLPAWSSLFENWSARRQNTGKSLNSQSVIIWVLITGLDDYFLNLVF